MIPKNALKLLCYDIQTNDFENLITRSLAESFREHLFSPDDNDNETILFAIPRKRHFYSKFSPSRFYSSLQRAFSEIQASKYVWVISANLIVRNELVYVYSDVVAPFLSSQNFIATAWADTSDKSRYRKIVSLPKGVEIYRYIFAQWRRAR